jgi:hypothetical protein
MVLRPALLVIAVLAMAAGAAQARVPARVAVVAGASCGGQAAGPYNCRDAVVARRAYLHWFVITRRSTGNRDGLSRHERAVIREEVVRFLLGAWWARGEAAERGIVVSSEEVRESFERQRSESFPSHATYRRFLRMSGQREADLLFRVRTDLLTEAVGAQVIAPARGDPEEEARLLAEHARSFSARWRRASRCSPGYAVARMCRRARLGG